jgi:hypothetical protein
MVIVELVKLAIFMFFFTVFGLALVMGRIPESSASQIQEDTRKEVFMEDCLSVTMNTKLYCERTFKELTEAQ